VLSPVGNTHAHFAHARFQEVNQSPWPPRS